MVWFIHQRFGMVCSTTTCSKIKRKWVKVIEAEERGERLDPAEAQELVRLEAAHTRRDTTARSHEEAHAQPLQPAEAMINPSSHTQVASAALQQTSYPPVSAGNT